MFSEIEHMFSAQSHSFVDTDRDFKIMERIRDNCMFSVQKAGTGWWKWQAGRKHLQSWG
jgi:hypothetical protein